MPRPGGPGDPPPVGASALGRAAPRPGGRLMRRQAAAGGKALDLLNSGWIAGHQGHRPRTRDAIRPRESRRPTGDDMTDFLIIAGFAVIVILLVGAGGKKKARRRGGRRGDGDGGGYGCGSGGGFSCGGGSSCGGGGGGD